MFETIMELTGENFTRLDEISTLLRISSDSTIAFVRCNEPVLSDAIYTEIKHRISDDVFIYEIKMNKNSTNLFQLLNEAARSELYNSKKKDNKKIVFFVFGLDSAIEKKTQDGRREALLILNMMREDFLQIKHTIMIWINSSTLSAILKEALDFFSWRTTVFEFDIKREERIKLIAYYGETDVVFLNRKELEERWENYSRLLGEYRMSGIEDAFKYSYWNFNLGTIKLLAGHAKEAIEYFEKSLEFSEQSSDKKGKANSLGMLGSAYLDMGEVEKAIEYYEKSLVLSREIGDKFCEGNNLENLGLAYSRSGKVEKASMCYEKAQSLRLLRRLHPLRIFLCYSREDKPAVHDLYRRLLVEGFDPWLDEEKLLPGQNWENEVSKAVRSSDAVIICLSQRDSGEMGYIQKEIRYALDAANKLPRENIFIIPLKLEECDIPEELSLWQWVNLFEDRGFELLIRLLHKVRLLPYINSIGMKFALIPAGEFMMGSEEFEWEKPVHKVAISKPFYLGAYPVTQREWKEVMGNNPSYFKGDNLPVEGVSWNDVRDFIKKLNENEGTNKYRLPSEAEWEYAVRACTTTRYFFRYDISKLSEYAWYYENSEFRTHPVGQKKPNPWGLYDMHGNVWEWVQDKWHENYEEAPSDGSAWEGVGSARVGRGGSWLNYAGDCRSGLRGHLDPGRRFDGLGFRLLREL